MNINTAKALDVLERSLWTALQIVSAGAIVEFFGLDLKWTIPIGFGLAALKGALATMFGNGTASSLPPNVEPGLAVGKHEG